MKFIVIFRAIFHLGQFRLAPRRPEKIVEPPDLRPRIKCGAEPFCPQLMEESRREEVTVDRYRQVDMILDNHHPTSPRRMDLAL
jgi:hypothetical protein